MADIWTKERRSEVMRKVRSRGNATTEVKLLMLFREAGITGWRRHVPIMGRPDFAFLRKKLAIFVDGDFWHGRGNRAVPVSNRRFWCAKFEQNKKRDRFVNRELRTKGWTVLRIWESDLARSKQRCLRRIERALKRLDG